MPAERGHWLVRGTAGCDAAVTHRVTGQTKLRYCKWCSTQKLSMWNMRIFCKLCEDLHNEIVAELKLRQLTEIAEIGKRRIFKDGRRDDFIPGFPQRKQYPNKYEGPERRKFNETGTIFDRKDYP